MNWVLNCTRPAHKVGLGGVGATTTQLWIELSTGLRPEAMGHGDAMRMTEQEVSCGMRTARTQQGNTTRRGMRTACPRQHKERISPRHEDSMRPALQDPNSRAC